MLLMQFLNGLNNIQSVFGYFYHFYKYQYTMKKLLRALSDNTLSQVE